ncbi:hypothetical protein Mnod_2033 [Methylobacterium nodulans ORS 2060]|uniref:Uncharacterized protein n=1 Tax=Methylobacterium nodulans (strain LMG 21967 / CNCM I-2342 / ORS 2060) TaxID=460265 RepID=B8ITD3_METNO|nr:hypothetical protein Mnod_2033 [Methylobacterium nodulans ORS 2060]
MAAAHAPRMGADFIGRAPYVRWLTLGFWPVSNESTQGPMRQIQTGVRHGRRLAVAG